MVLAYAAAAVAPIPVLKKPVLGLKELVKEPVDLVSSVAAAAAGAPVGSSISGKLPDPSGKRTPKKVKRRKKGISYKRKKSGYDLTAAKSNLNLVPSTNFMGVSAATTVTTSSSPPSPNKNALKRLAIDQSVTSSRRKVKISKLSQDVAYYQTEAAVNLRPLQNLWVVMNDRQLVEKKLMENNSKSVKKVQTRIQTIKILSSPLKAEKEKSRTVIARMMDRRERTMNDTHSLSLALTYKEKELKTEKLASRKREKDCYEDGVADERAWSLQKVAMRKSIEEGREKVIVASGKFQFAIVCNTRQFMHQNLI